MRPAYRPGYNLYMANTPRPAGWQGGSEEFEILRTFDGHIGVNSRTDPEFAANICARRNTRRGFEEADIGGAYDPDVQFDEFMEGA